MTSAEQRSGDKWNYGIRGKSSTNSHCYSSVIRDHFCNTDPTMTLAHTVATTCSNTDLSSQWCNNVLQQWPRLVLSLKCAATITCVHIVATMCYINDIGPHYWNTVLRQWPRSHCCNNVLQQLPRFTLLQQCSPAITSVHIVATRMVEARGGGPGPVGMAREGRAPAAASVEVWAPDSKHAGERPRY
jgi:hypothetical protein